MGFFDDLSSTLGGLADDVSSAVGSVVDDASSAVSSVADAVGLGDDTPALATDDAPAVVPDASQFYGDDSTGKGDAAMPLGSVSQGQAQAAVQANTPVPGYIRLPVLMSLAGSSDRVP